MQMSLPKTANTSIRLIDDAEQFKELERLGRQGLTESNKHTDYGRNLSVSDCAFVYQSGEAQEGVITCNHCGDWLYIHYLWVSEACRGRGIGRSLIQAAEERAISMQCCGVHLVTMEYQAVEFYKKCGYQEFARLDGYADNHARIYFKKEL